MTTATTSRTKKTGGRSRGAKNATARPGAIEICPKCHATDDDCGPAKTPAKSVGVSAETVAVEAGSGERPATVMVPLDKIHRRPSNRGGRAVAMPDVADLADQIERCGLATPVLLRTESDEQELPVGHYELIAGERRCQAFRAIGRDEIPAVILSGLTAQQAGVLVAVDNTHRRDLDPIERARSIRELIGRHGLLPVDAGRCHGLGESAAKNAMRLLELPESIQDHVAAGRLPERSARYLVPYAGVPGIMAQAEREIRDQHSWWTRANESEAQVKFGVQRLVRENVRPLSGKHDYGYQLGYEHARYFELTDSLRKKLNVVTIRIDNKPVEVATNVKLWDKCQVPLIKAKLAEKNRGQGGGKATTKGKGGAAGKDSTPKLTPAQQRAKEKDQDEQLRDRINRPYGLRELAWRWAMVLHIKPGHEATEELYDLLIDTARDGEGTGYLDVPAWRYEAERLLRARVQPGKTPAAKRGYSSRESYAEYFLATAAMCVDRTTERQWLHATRAALILWPQQRGIDSERLGPPDELPTRWPAVVPAVIEWYAATMGVSAHDTWDDAALPTGPARQWLSAFLRAHNRRQLERLAKEMGAGQAIAGTKTRGEMIDRLLLYHGLQTRLKMPGCLGFGRGKTKRKPA